MKPLLAAVVAICLLSPIIALPENIEDVKALPQEKEPIVEAEDSSPQVRAERCTNCASGQLKFGSPNEVLAALQTLPGGEVHTQSTFEGCSSEKGCAGLKVKDGKVIEKFGNVDAFRAAAANNAGNEFSFHAAGSNVFEGGIPKDGPFWWMNENSPFKAAGGAGGGSYEKFSKSSSSSYTNGGANAGLTNGGGASFTGSIDLSGNPFLNGDISKLSSGFASGAGQSASGSFGGTGPAGNQFLNRPSGAGNNYQSSSFESSSFSSNNKGAGGELDLSKNPFLNGGYNSNKFGQGASFQGSSQGSANPQAAGGAVNKYSSSSSQSTYTGSSPSPFTAYNGGNNVNLIQNGQKSEFEYEQQGQQNIDEAFKGTGNVHGHEHAGGELQTCAGQGYVCVHKAQCNNGVVNTNGVGILQAQTKKQYCNTKTEICCRIEVGSIAGAGGLQGTLGVGSATFSGGSNSREGGIFASNSGSNAFGTTSSGGNGFGTSGSSNTGVNSFGASGSSSSSFGAGQKTNTQNTFGSGSTTGSGSNGANGFGATTGFASGSSNSFGSSTNVRGSGSNSFGSNTFGAGSNSQGAQGFQGSQGTQGLQGTQGAQGFQGTQGSQSFQGSQGSKTFQGAQGSQGTGFGVSATFGQGQGQQGQQGQGFNGGGVNSFESSSSSFESKGTFGSNGFNSNNNGNFGAGSTGNTGASFGTTLQPNSFGSTGTRFGITGSGYSGGNDVLVQGTKNTQTNFVETDSFSSGSDFANAYRPGASGSRLKPGVPYLPPVASNTVTSTVFPPTQGYTPTSPRPIYTTPKPVFVSSSTPPPYLPPVGGIVPEPSTQIETSFPPPPPQRPSPPPVYTTGGVIFDANRFPPNKPINNQVPSGCAAALKCTPIEFCTAEGVISNTTIILTKDQETFRVPLTDCKDLQSGLIGKCCRDPTYTDPWPVNQLGKWIPENFGDTGKYNPTYNQGTTLIPETRTTVRPFRQEVIQQGGGGGGGIRVSQGFNRQDSQYETTKNVNKFGANTNQQGVSQGFNRQDSQYETTKTVNKFGGNTNQQGVSQGFNRQDSQFETSKTVNKYAGNSFNANGNSNSNGFTSIRGGGGGLITQNGFGIEQHGSESSLYRVFLQQYNGGGQCGIFNGQKPYGNRNELEVDFAEIPWQAMVLLQTNRSLLCGGVITRPDVVITSAACLEGLEAQNVLIKGGEWKLGIDEEPLPFQIVQVKNILRHPGYRHGSYHYDVAILVLAENLRFAKNIYPICLPEAEETLDAYYNGAGECIVTGWGKQVLQAHLAGSILHSLNVSLINPGECQAKLTSDYPHLLEQYDQNSCACGVPTNPINNICKVDIGSALACTTGNGHYVLRGIYSWDSGCQLGNQLAAFFKFDLAWYLWALGLSESTGSFSQFISSSQQYSNQFNSGNKGGAGQFGISSNQFNSGIKGGAATGQFGVTSTQFGSGVKGGSGQFGITSNQYSGQVVKGGQVSGKDQFGFNSNQYNSQAHNGGTGQFGVTTNQFASQVNSGVKQGQFNANNVKGGGQFGVSSGSNQYSGLISSGESAQAGGVKGVGIGGLGFTAGLNGQFGNQFNEFSQFATSKFAESGKDGAGFNIGGQIKGPIQNSYSASYTEKKVFKSDPVITTFTTKPEIITYSYTTKPQIITYETSGSGQNPQYVAPGVTYNPSFSQLVGHQHTADCKCGKK